MSLWTSRDSGTLTGVSPSKKRNKKTKDISLRTLKYYFKAVEMALQTLDSYSNRYKTTLTYGHVLCERDFALFLDKLF